MAAASAVQLVTYPNGAVVPALPAYPTAYYGVPGASGLVAYANGAVAPAKTPEVIAAEQAHFAEHGIAAPAVYTGYPAWNFAGLVRVGNAVVPVESPEVARARAEHLAAHAAA